MLTIRIPSPVMFVAASLVLAAAPVAFDPGRLATDGSARFAATGGALSAVRMAARTSGEGRAQPGEPWHLSRFMDIAPRALATTPPEPAAETRIDDPGTRATAAAAGALTAASVDVDTLDPTIAAAAQALSRSPDKQLAALIMAALNGSLALAVPDGRDAAETAPRPPGSGRTAMSKSR